MELKTINYQGTDITVSKDGNLIIWNGVKRNIYFNKDGYSVCAIKIPNKGWRSVRICRLVALAYIPNPLNLPEVNHKDYNRKNSNVNNLEWITHQDNVTYSKCNLPNRRGRNNPNYGNKKLSVIYRTDKEYTLEKQSRHGIQNGRATKVDLFYDDKYIKSFDYIVPCCQYFIDNNIANTQNPETVRVQLNKCIREKRKYKGHYSIIKR